MNRTVNSTRPSTANFCTGTTQACMTTGESIILSGTAAISVILNTAHILILLGVAQLHNRPLRKILIAISISDIFTGLISLAQFNCLLKDHLFNHPRNIFLFVFAVVGSAAPSFHFCILFLAVFERYYIICRNLNYKDNIIIKNLGLTIIALLIEEILIFSILVIALPDNICLHDVTGPFLSHGRIGSVVLACSMMLVIGASLILGMRILISLKRSIVASTDNQHVTRKMKNAAGFILVIIVLYTTIFTFQGISYILLPAVGSPNHTAQYLSCYAYELYGIVNTIVYGWMSSAYRREVKKIASSILPACFSNS